MFVIRDLSSRGCVLDGYPVIEMIGSDGKPLHTVTIHSGGTPLPVTIIQGSVGQVCVTLGPSSCSGPAVTQVKLALPRILKPILVPVGSPHQPFSPCDGKIGVSPIEPA